MVPIQPCTWLSARRVALAWMASAAATMLSLAGCINSEQPLLEGGVRPFGDAAKFQFYSLRDGAAYDPIIAELRWNGSRYSVNAVDVDKDNAVSLHLLDADTFILQAIDGRPGRPVEYAVLRQIADGVYLVNPVDEDDADDAIKAKFCASRAVCRVTNADQVMGLARATAAKRYTRGGLAIRLAAEK